MQSDTRAELCEAPLRFWGLGLTIWIGLLLSLATGVAVILLRFGRFRVAAGAFDLSGWEVPSALLGIASAIAAARAIRCRLPRRVIALEPSGLSVPTVFRRSSRLIPYADIESAALSRVRLLRRTFLAIGARHAGPTILSDRRFGPPEGLREFRDSLLTRIGALPSGAERLPRVEARSRADERPFGIPWLSFAVVVTITGPFWASPETSAASTYQWGLIRGLVTNGELFRIVSANGVHADVFHAIANSVAVLVYGWLGERVLGWRRMLAIGLATGCLAFLGFALAPSAPFELAVGLSGWSFGWIGVWLWLRAWHRAALPPLLQSRALAATLCAPLLVQGSPVASINVAHATGFVIGPGLAAWLTRRWRGAAEPVGVAAGRWIVGACTATLVGALAWGLMDGRDGPEEDGRQVLRWLLEDPDAAARSVDDGWEDFNNAAWLAAATPNASRAWLLEAERAAEWAAANTREGHHPALLDTLATVRYRLGDFDAAVDLAWQAANAVSDDAIVVLLVTQAARFELARVRALGELRVGGAPEVRLGRADGASALRASVDAASDDDLEVHAVALERGAPVAHLRLYLTGPIEAAAPIEIPLDERSRDALAGSDELVITRAEATAEPAPDWRVLVQALDPDTLALP